jgi:hypothetical protein
MKVAADACLLTVSSARVYRIDSDIGGLMRKPDGVPVKIDRTIYDQIKDYALFHNKNVQQVVNSGLAFWLETWAETKTEHTLEKIATEFSQHEASKSN